MITQHTQGPWKFLQATEEDMARVYAPDCIKGATHVASVSKNDDAALIAAAPELLAALKAIVAALDQTITVKLRHENAIFNGDVSFIENLAQEAIAKVYGLNRHDYETAKEAIAKATGES